jgi:hypothetical protein
MAATVRHAVAGILALVTLCLLERPVWAKDPRAHLEVVRMGGGAGECPDASALEAAVRRVRGEDPFEEASPSISLRFDVTFARDSSGYVATIHEDGTRKGERTIAGGRSSCVELADAVAAAITVMLDGAGQAASSGSPSDAPKAEVAPPVAAGAPTGRDERTLTPPAPPPDLTEPPPTPRRALQRKWYGWQILIVDGTTVGVVAASSLLRGKPWTDLSFPTVVALYLVGPPVVHVVHGRVGVAIGDVFLRGGLALAGAFVGDLIGVANTCSGCFVDQAPYLFLGLSVGIGSAVALDAALLAYDPPKRKASPAGMRWTPVVARVPGGITAGLAGAFF